MQGLGCEYITFKNTVNMFGLTQIAESIYEGVVEPYYIKTYYVIYQLCWYQNKNQRSILLVKYSL